MSPCADGRPAVRGGLCALLAAVLLVGGCSSPRRSVDSALIEAARAGDAARIEQLVRLGADPNRGDPVTGAAPLLYAMLAPRNADRAVESLLACGADPNRPIGEAAAMAPLCWAISYGDGSTVSVLLDGGADPHLPAGANGQTALCWAVERGALPAAEALLAHGVDPNERLADGATALHGTAGSPALARLLLAHGADPRLRDDQGRTAAEVAWEEGDRETEALLREVSAESAPSTRWDDRAQGEAAQARIGYSP